MDRSLHVAVGGIMVGAWAGFGAGYLFAIARRSWHSVSAAKRNVVTARRAAWWRSREAVALIFVLAVAVAFALGHG